MKTKITFFIAIVTLLFSVSNTSAQTNLFTNPSFEDADLSAWRMLEIYTDPFELLYFNVDAASTAVIDNFASDGVQAILVTWGDDNMEADFADYRLDQVVAGVEEGESYNFNFDALTDGGNMLFALYIEWHGAGGFISTTDGVDNRFLEVLEGGDYVGVNGGAGEVYVAPAGATSANLGIKARYGDGSGGSLGLALDGTATLLDNFSFTKVDALSTDDRVTLDFSVYPNPATDIVNIQSKTAISMGSAVCATHFFRLQIPLRQK